MRSNKKRTRKTGKKGLSAWTPNALWDRLVWRYCVNEHDKASPGTAQAGEETLFWFKGEASALAWLLITVLLPGYLPAEPTAIAAFVYLFSHSLRSHRASRPLDMQCTVLDTGASLMGVMLAIPFYIGFAVLITVGLIFIGGLY